MIIKLFTQRHKTIYTLAITAAYSTSDKTLTDSDCNQDTDTGMIIKLFTQRHKTIYTLAITAANNTTDKTVILLHINTVTHQQ